MKKIISLLMSLVICLGIVAGCNVQTDTNQITDTSTVATQTEAIVTTQATEKSTTQTETTVTTQTTTEETINIEDIEFKKNDIKFSDIKYEHVDESQWLEIKDKVLTAEKEQNIDKLLECIEDMDEFIDYIDSMASVARIILDMDTTNEENSAEYTYAQEFSTNMYREYINVYYHLIEESNMKDLVRAELSEEEIEAIYHYHTTLTDEYVEINNKIKDIQKQYDALENNITVNIDGQDLKVDEILNYYSPLTMKSYGEYKIAIKQFYKNFSVKAGELYVELLKLYKDLAKICGYDDPVEFFYEYVFEKEYSLEDEERYWKYVKDYIVPLEKKLSTSITSSESSKIERINDTSDPIDKYQKYYEAYFKEISPLKYEAYLYLNKNDLFYHSSSSKMAPGSYTTYLSYYDLPMIVMSENNTLSDLTTFIHEFGHFYSYYISDEITYDLDLAEIASQASELLFTSKYYKQMFASAYKAFFKYKLVESLGVIIDSAIQDKFQKEAFRMEDPTPEKLNSLYETIAKEYNYSLGNNTGWIDYDIYWTLYPHSFQSPFYYISYGTSLIPALQILEISLTDYEEAIEKYNIIAYVDEGTTFYSALEKAGLSSPFEEQTFIDIVELVYNMTGVK